MSKRILKLNELLKRELGQIFLKEIDFPKGVLVTITEVSTSANLSEARIKISVMPKKETNRIMMILNEQIYNLQQMINRRLRMRPIPKIRFQEEKRTGQAARIEELLEKLRKEKK